MNQEMTQLQSDYRIQGEELTQLREKEQQWDRQRLVLQGEYDSLKNKYDELVRPARTAQGKHIVEVRYEKVRGKTQIQYKDSDDKNYQNVTYITLERKLDALKKRYPDQLYVKIVIPADSGLSYSEAWGFMSELLEKYDYYYQ